MAFQSWEQFAAEHGISAEAPPKSAKDPVTGEAVDHDMHKAYQDWSALHNQWTDMLASSGEKPSEQGVYNKHEEGQSMFAGWDQNWREAQANDPRAQQFANSKDYQGFVNTYENPWVAYQNWQRVQGNQQQNNPHSSSAWQHNPGGGYWDVVGSGPGAHRVNYDEYGRPTGGPTAMGATGGYGGAPGTSGGPSGGGYNTTGYVGTAGAQGGQVGGGAGMAGSSQDSWDDYKKKYGMGGDAAPGGQNWMQGGGGGEFNIPGYDSSGKPQFNFEDVPQFNAPKFQAPTAATEVNDPGYQFRLQQGMDALEHSKAAQGLLRGGGTLKDLVGYNQNFASQEFQNVYNRSLASYDRNFAAAQAQYAPQLMGWQTRAGAEQAGTLAQYAQNFQNYSQMQNWYLQMYQAAMAAAAQGATQMPTS